MSADSGGPRPAAGIRKITRADFETAGALMARAFDDDPVINYMVKQDGKREQRLRRFMDVGLRKLTFPYGETYITDAGDGAAYWNPPGGRPHGLLSDLSLLPTFPSVTGLGGMVRAINAFAMVEKKHPKEPHYYLLAIGVDPEAQGHGIGSALLAPMAERFDREGAPAYLESSKERNVPLSERFGFKVTEAYNLPKDGLESGPCGAIRSSPSARFRHSSDHNPRDSVALPDRGAPGKLAGAGTGEHRDGRTGATVRFLMQRRLRHLPTV